MSGNGNAGAQSSYTSGVGGGSSATNVSAIIRQMPASPAASPVAGNHHMSAAVSQTAASAVAASAAAVVSAPTVAVQYRDNGRNYATPARNFSDRYTIAVSSASSSTGGCSGGADNYEAAALAAAVANAAAANHHFKSPYEMHMAATPPARITNFKLYQIQQQQPHPQSQSQPKQASFEGLAAAVVMSGTPPPPQSKTPDVITNENWLTSSSNAITNNNASVSRRPGTLVSGGSGGGASADSDHELLESSGGGSSSATCMSGSNGAEGDESADDELDSTSYSQSTSIGGASGSLSSSLATGGAAGLRSETAAAAATIAGEMFEDADDYTTKRLKTFVATTLHNERVYLDKLAKLLAFKRYLEEYLHGAQADTSVLFSGIQQIYTTHDIVAAKLQEYLDTPSDIVIGNNQISSKHTSCSARSLTSTQSTAQPTSPPSLANYTFTANWLMKQSFLSSALQLLANIMEISFPVYLEFLKNYSKSMTILNKLENHQSPSSSSSSSGTANASAGNSSGGSVNHVSAKVGCSKSFVECQHDFNALLVGNSVTRDFLISPKAKRNSSDSAAACGSNGISTKDPYSIYYNDVKKNEERFDLTRIFSEEILRRPTKLFEFIYSLKEECFLASNELPAAYSGALQANIKSLFENESSKSLREKVFDEINRNIMPKEVRKNEDVVELVESNHERKIRHLILYGDCLVCCKLKNHLQHEIQPKRDKRQLRWFIPIDQLEIFLDEIKTAKSETELRHLRDEVVSLRKKQTDENASARNQQKLKKKLVEQENELTIQSSRLKLIVRSNPSLSVMLLSATGNTSNANISNITSNNNGSNNTNNVVGYQSGLSSPLSTQQHHQHNYHQTSTSLGVGGGSNSGGFFSNPTLAAISISMTNLANLASPGQSHNHYKQQQQATVSSSNSSGAGQLNQPTYQHHHHHAYPLQQQQPHHHQQNQQYNSSSTTTTTSISNSSTNSTNTSQQFSLSASTSFSSNAPTSAATASAVSTAATVAAANNYLNKYVFLFTSDFERIAWLEEIHGAIYAFKARKTTASIQMPDIEARINSLKKIEEPPKAVTSSCTGSLELLIKHIEELPQPNKVFVAVELKSCGSYLQVAQTRCSDLTKNPAWNEKFNLELQCVDALRIILYCETSGKALAISSQELNIDSNANLNKITCAKLNNGMLIHLSMKFLSPKKTITRRRTRNRNDIFGGNLAELLQREKSSIPRILKDCVEVIETKGIEEVGIYRVSSVVSEVQKMKDLYSKNPNLALNELRQKSPHLSANVLKLYLRELPDPLFTSQAYHRFMAALDCSPPEFRFVELCRIFNDLPESNRTIIIFVLTHLLNIASHANKNMMGLQNLCTLFGPTLMKLSPKDNLQVEDMGREIKESMQQAQVLFYILQLHSDDKLISEPEQKQQEKQQQLQQQAVVAASMLTTANTKKLPDNQAATTPLCQSTLSTSLAATMSIDRNNNSISPTVDAAIKNKSSKPLLQASEPNNSSNSSGERFSKSSMQTAL